MIAEIANNNRDAADIFFLVAVILFAVAGFFGFRRGTLGDATDGYAILLAVGAACVSLGWLLL